MPNKCPACGSTWFVVEDEHFISITDTIEIVTMKKMCGACGVEKKEYANDDDTGFYRKRKKLKDS